MKMKLKKDVIIKKGTILDDAPVFTRRVGFSHKMCVIGLTRNSSGFFTYYVDPDDPELTEWFEEIPKKGERDNASFKSLHDL